ncbi:DUF300-domain-containing protein [Auriscalpium vulgare]|uniref:DUF300-domain-containing protein n=1 Tax=Auriscalpium vulgare TaxID=40419 RepID=A0ACB8RZ24_9AGAM|nr:DUF300-domain-containing protein [Auriscalpium vulgare]
MPQCPSENTQIVDQSSFWSAGSLHWDEHRIGWAIAGSCAAVTVLISLVSVLQHCRRNYTNRAEQRQILRILYMPPIYAVISFFSYRYFRSFTYYSLIQVVYEAVTLSAFLLLLIEYVAATASGHSAEHAIARKDKHALPIPFCCWRYRPTKAYFMYTLKWSVLQYVVIRPAVSIAGIICQHYGVLCEAGSYSVHFAKVYLDSIDFVSISVALYGLILFYALTKDELVGRRPLSKFLAIKLIVMATFYQSFVFSALEGRVIKGTDYWTATNIADGLNALAICIEMIFFASFMMWAYTWNEYKVKDGAHTSIWRPLWDSINYADFAVEIFSSFAFFLGFRRRPAAARPAESKTADFGNAFGVEGYRPVQAKPTGRTSYDDDIRLAPYSPQTATPTARAF